MPPLGVNYWHVTGATLVPSLQPYTPTYQIPAMTDVTFQELVNGNGVVLTAGQGTLFVNVVRNGTPVTGAIASVTPPAEFATFYDGGTSTVWTTMSTGILGDAWMAGITAGTVTVLVTPNGGTQQSVPGITIVDGANTFLTVEVP